MAGYRPIPPQTQRIRKPWNYRHLTRLKYWHSLFQEDQNGQLLFDIEGAEDTEDKTIMLGAALSDTINTTGLETSGHHITDEFINMLL